VGKFYFLPDFLFLLRFKEQHSKKEYRFVDDFLSAEYLIIKEEGKIYLHAKAKIFKKDTVLLGYYFVHQS